MKIFKTTDGNLLELIDEGAVTIDGLEELEPNTVDASLEKHVPVIEEVVGGILVKIGAEEHPMLPEHYIMWIEARTDSEVQRKYLNPGDAPEAKFSLPAEGVTAYCYCNIHGLWRS